MPLVSLRADASVGAIAFSPSCRDVVLAGRSGLYIVDLKEPLALPRWLPLRSAWDVASVQWCPAISKQSRVASSSNQKVLVWNLELPSNQAIEHVLHGHRRAVTDISFNKQQPELLASASIDTTVKVWDLRTPFNSEANKNGSVLTFSDFDAGALQSRWNPVNEFQIASSHSNRIVVWDQRKNNVPYAKIYAHQSECNCVRYLADGRILSCSTDKTVKLWDTESNIISTDNSAGVTNEAVLTVTADFPIWKAVPTPFELGAQIIPLRGGDNDVKFINLAHSEKSVSMEDACIGGFKHPEPVKDSVYVRDDNSISQYNVATWCSDSHMRIWDAAVMMNLPHASTPAGCKDKKCEPIPETSSYNTDRYDKLGKSQAHKNSFELPILHLRRYKTQIEHFDWISGVELNQNSRERKPALSEDNDINEESDLFAREIKSVITKFPRVEIFNKTDGLCQISLLGPWKEDNELAKVIVDIAAPPDYPSQSLSVNVQPNPEFREDALHHISEFMISACKELAVHNVPSLEICIRYLVGDNPSVQDSLAYHSRSLGGDNGILINGDLTEESSVSSNKLKSVSEESSELELAVNSENHRVSDLAISDSFRDQESDVVMEENDSISGLDELDLSSTKQANVIDSTPLPKNSGAVWSARGKLVCFFNHRVNIKEKGPLPLDKVFAEDNESDDGNSAPFISDSDEFELDNSLKWSVAMRIGSKIGLTGTSNNSFNLLNRQRSRTVTTLSSEHDNSEILLPSSIQEVTIQNFSHLWPSRPEVASEYRNDIDGNPLEVVQHNYEVAKKYELNNDAYIWNILAEYIKIEMMQYDKSTLNEIAQNSLIFDWGGGFMGLRSFVPKIAAELERQDNIQLLACVSCLFSSIRGYRFKMSDRAQRERHTIHQNIGTRSLYRGSSGSTISSTPAASKYSNSGTDSNNASLNSNANVKYTGNTRPHDLISRNSSSSVVIDTDYKMPIETDTMNIKLITPDVIQGWGEWDPLECQRWIERSTSYRKQYAKLLHIWGLDIKRVEVLKLNWDDPLIVIFKPLLVQDHQQNLVFSTEVSKPNNSCALCSKPVNRLFVHCVVCLHAMHSACARQWWVHESQCPAACGCDCKSYVSPSTTNFHTEVKLT